MLSFEQNKLNKFIGRKFNRLTILSFSEKVFHKTSSQYKVKCKCDCGKICEKFFSKVKNGHTISCGCFRNERIAKVCLTHGMSNSKEFFAFNSAKQRCENPKDKDYLNYGGRGIQFLFKSFEEFYAEIGDSPSIHHSIDRKNNNGHYEKGNVRWATYSEQNFNRRKCTL